LPPEPGVESETNYTYRSHGFFNASCDGAGFDASLSPRTTLPISFTRSIDANHVHAGDAISAKLTQPVHLANGQVIPAGARVAGHVVTANGFAFDSTPYAKQKQSALSIHFDSVDGYGVHLPLNVYVRAMADPITAWDARRPKPSDEDPLGTTQQIGGDLVTPSQSGVMSQDGDIVGYQRHGGIYARMFCSQRVWIWWPIFSSSIRRRS
jgi:hypothetical protein